MLEPTFDIFSGTPDKDALWLEAVSGLERARLRMHRIAAEKPGRYFLFRTQSQSVVASIDSTKKRRKKLKASS
jgi:hypothetical protein